MSHLKPITLAELENHLAAGHLRLALIGMSNVGKTYWAKLLAQDGFAHICCDDLIEQKLGHELLELGYVGGIADMAKWLGQPYDERFAANQQRYLQLETDVMQEIIASLEDGSQTGNIVVDTTGSVVHIDPAIRQKLSGLTTVVYLEASGEMQQEMFQLYIAEPKPVVWEDKFKVKAAETQLEALVRCYPELLGYRSGLYAATSHVTLPREASLAMTSSGVASFLAYIKSMLPKQ
jgi:shikimate kinase